ncbi:replication factor C subunit 1 [Nematocida parisii]|nr:replication factor C subunit 1 [Nematocida parisii]KAI5131259.1 replication factor C subunit 1 [Nematocida parisii]KAI5145234.1 replication factor C subunit 1 [Nematocida parisii]KAI5156795.1 replication factor C subunit 1 [Nematocida parisii]KAI5158984.1 replication factor C subunit 1 [Nematocida parisii]
MKRKEEDLPYTGRTFVVTGTTKTPREDLVNRIRELGGKVTLGISGVTTYLIAGEEPGPAKLKKAVAHGTKILSEEDFIEMTSHYIILPIEVKKSKPEVYSKERWCDKYKPETSSDILGNKQTITQLKTHLLSMSRAPILLTGSSGCGKTLSAYLIAKELGISLIEYNGADYRNKQEVSIIKGLSTQKSLTHGIHLHKNKALLMEEIENMTSSDRGGLQEILNLFKETKIPIILTTNNKGSQNLKTIISKCKVISYSKIDSRSITNLLKTITIKEGISVPENTLMQISVTAGGDVRYAINMLQYLSKKDQISTEDIKIMGKHITSSNLFDVTKEILQSYNSPAHKINLFFEEPLFALLMVFENYLGEDTLKSIANTADTLSTAEIISGRMINSDEKRLFPVAAYYTAVKPRIKISSKLAFSKYIGQISAQSASKKKMVRIINESTKRSFRGGWSVLYNWLSTMLMLESKNTHKEDILEYIHALNMDKTVLQALSELTNIKIKPSTLPLIKPQKE